MPLKSLLLDVLLKFRSSQWYGLWEDHANEGVGIALLDHNIDALIPQTVTD